MIPKSRNQESEAKLPAKVQNLQVKHHLSDSHLDIFVTLMMSAVHSTYLLLSLKAPILSLSLPHLFNVSPSKTSRASKKPSSATEAKPAIAALVLDRFLPSSYCMQRRCFRTGFQPITPTDQTPWFFWFCFPRLAREEAPHPEPTYLRIISSRATKIRSFQEFCSAADVLFNATPGKCDFKHGIVFHDDRWWSDLVFPPLLPDW